MQCNFVAKQVECSLTLAPSTWWKFPEGTARRNVQMCWFAVIKHDIFHFHIFFYQFEGSSPVESHILTVTWLDVYSGAILLIRTIESYGMTQQSRNRVPWLSAMGGSTVSMSKCKSGMDYMGHILTVTWFDVYSGAILLIRTYKMTQHRRNRVTWLSRHGRFYCINVEM